MGSLLAVFALVWLATFLSAPQLGDSWGWDISNALGLAAYAGILYLSLPGQPKQSLKAHECLGYVVLVLIAAHALWFLFFDVAAAEYIKPGAPLYMWSGLLGVATATILVALARLPARVSQHTSYDRFRQLHLALSIGTICLSAHHIIVSGLYLQTPLQVVSFLLVAAAVIIARPLRYRPPSKVSPQGFLLVGAVCVAIFAVIRNGLSF